MLSLKETLSVIALMLVPGFCLALNEGSLAPDFSLPIFDQTAVMESSDYLGKVVYLDFWASWCGPCQISVPKLIELQADLNSDEFEVVAINVDEEADRARRFLGRFDINYTVLADPAGNVASRYELKGMPTAFIIDQEGRIMKIHTGFRQGDMKEIRLKINELLN
ncbi:MAG: TlpA family protein disulfide reductase [Gammaproteobacteria bacterium]|jgi:thiol-disulfide isomerase/thioredoxin|nr:TlpA family protein disulfide reductase [Gammaproteobacteria bacterium]MBT5204506.1 TlpA family protein disulfide reductase [Gammaproteobacteria bacterium]MBT5604161.1 TlpA family protein disulfide reductase [Gammaproteobacteria bacterium]MBT6246746.1 TlpA family protein disulfide reductase [Gammaproteobacteria bacterium]